MARKNLRRYIALFAAALLLIVVAVTAFFHVPAKTASAAEDTAKFDETDVLDDLRSIEGFNILQYPPLPGDQPSMYVINVAEYCYSFYPSLRGNYGLYIYVYNPYGLNINVNDFRNRVQIAVKYDTYPITEDSRPLEYEKFRLQLCSVSEEPNYKRLFYKFKVVDHESADGKTIAERVNGNGRRYDISGIELVRNGYDTADEYPLTGQHALQAHDEGYGSFLFTGYAAGYGPDSGAESTLHCDIGKLETVELNVKHTFYRTQTSSMGYGYQNQIDTVYFSVPKRLFDEYGSLQRIKAEWYEYRTKPFLVTSNKEYYDWISDHIGETVDQVPDDRYFVTEPFEAYPDDLARSAWFLLAGGGVPAILWAIPKGHRVTDFAVNGWNVAEGWETALTVDPLYYIFGTKDWCAIDQYDPYAEDIAGAGGVSSNDLLEYIKNYRKTVTNGYLPIKNGQISADLFEADIDQERKMDNDRGKIQKGYSYYDFDADLDLQSWLSYSDVGHSFAETFMNFGFWAALFGNEDIPDESGRTISPIQVITPESKELKEDYSDHQLSDALFVNADDVTDFRRECEDAFSVDGSEDEEKYVVMFRFAVTDYYSESVWLGEFVDNGYDNYEKGQAYLAQETVFFDFDVIQLSFLKKEDWHVIAAVSDPIDIVDAITPPVNIRDDGEGWPLWLKWLIGIAAAVLLVILLWPVMPYIIKGAVWIVTLPFKLIGMIVNAVKGTKKRRKDKK